MTPRPCPRPNGSPWQGPGYPAGYIPPGSGQRSRLGRGACPCADPPSCCRVRRLCRSAPSGSNTLPPAADSPCVLDFAGLLAGLPLMRAEMRTLHIRIPMHRSAYSFVVQWAWLRLGSTLAQRCCAFSEGPRSTRRGASNVLSAVARRISGPERLAPGGRRLRLRAGASRPWGPDITAVMGLHPGRWHPPDQPAPALRPGRMRVGSRALRTRRESRSVTLADRGGISSAPQPWAAPATITKADRAA